MRLNSRLSGQEGFVREVLVITLVIAIVAVVLLDVMSIFNARQSVKDDTKTAAHEARTEYAQSLNQAAAKLAAEQYIVSSGLTWIDFSSKQGPEGTPVFTVTATTTADTFVFRFLKGIPQLKKWVERTTHPVGSSTSN